MAINVHDNIVAISYLDCIKIHCLSFLWGLWTLLKQVIIRVLYKKKSDFRIRSGRPPPCLMDTSFGQHSYIKLKGVKLHYVECGDRNKPIVLLLHGFPDCWISWRHQIVELSKYYRVIALDLKGFGDSDKPESRRCYRVGILVNELRDLIDSLGVTSCTIIGHDLGALLGWYLIHIHPDIVDKFVAISCPHPNLYWSHLPKSSSFNRDWIHYSQLPLLPEWDALQDDLRILNQCYQHLGRINEPYLDAYKYFFSRKEDWTGPINYYRNLPFWRVNTREEDAGVQVPCLLIVGSQDSAVHLESLIKSTNYLEKYALKLVDFAGHFPHQEQPEVVNKILLSYLIDKSPTAVLPKDISNSLVNRVFGVVTSTVRFGNHVLQKTASRAAT